MKLIGAIIILAASTWTGMEASKKLNLRPRQIRQLKVALQSLEAEIIYGHTSLSDVAQQLSKQLPKPLSWIFHRFASRLEAGRITAGQAWEQALLDVWPVTALNQNEFEIMKQFGETLGRHDRLQQQKQIQLAIAHLQREEEEAKTAQARYENMIKSLGFLAGLLIIILLM